MAARWEFNGALSYRNRNKIGWPNQSLLRSQSRKVEDRLS